MKANGTTIYTVSDICSLTGVTRKTLFYYDRIGLLKPAARTGPQNSKLYDPEGLLKLQRILRYREAGLQISEVRGLLRDDTDHQAILLAALARLRQEREQKEEQIVFLKGLLEETQKGKGKQCL
ncbi:MAG: MerR family transcriptional regulator [Solobacterium sp.]|nr:MerR family transcriptional regulator [Solobacterium sp.]